MGWGWRSDNARSLSLQLCSTKAFPSQRPSQRQVNFRRHRQSTSSWKIARNWRKCRTY